jgi:hypothetical protein
LTHIVKAEVIAVSVHAIKAYRGADVQLYAFLSLAVDRRELSASHVSSGEQTQYLLNRRLGWSQNQCGHSEEDIKITVTARNRALDSPAHSTTTVLTDLSQFFSTDMKDVPKIQ